VEGAGVGVTAAAVWVSMAEANWAAVVPMMSMVGVGLADTCGVQAVKKNASTNSKTIWLMISFFINVSGVGVNFTRVLPV
jgi:hypothetical protein